MLLTFYGYVGNSAHITKNRKGGGKVSILEKIREELERLKKAEKILKDEKVSAKIEELEKKLEEAKAVCDEYNELASNIDSDVLEITGLYKTIRIVGTRQ